MRKFWKKAVEKLSGHPATEAEQEFAPSSAPGETGDAPPAALPRTLYDKLFSEPVEQAKERFEKRIEADASLPDAAQMDEARAGVWQETLSEILWIKMYEKYVAAPRHVTSALPGYRSKVIDTVCEQGFAEDKAAANKLYKAVARHAHVALETIAPSDKELPWNKTLPAKPRLTEEQDGKGHVRVRGLDGRFTRRPTYPDSPANAELNESLAEMRADWSARLKTIQRPLAKAYREKLWELNKDTAIGSFLANCRNSSLNETLMLPAINSDFHNKYNLPILFNPVDNPEMLAQARSDVDKHERGTKEAVLLYYFESELKPLVWELIEKVRQEDSPVAASHAEHRERYFAQRASMMYRLDELLEGPRTTIGKILQEEGLKERIPLLNNQMKMLQDQMAKFILEQSKAHARRSEGRAV